MDFIQLIRVLVLALLLGYFVTKVVDSTTKLQEAKIGTLFRRITKETVEGRSQSYELMMLSRTHIHFT